VVVDNASGDDSSNKIQTVIADNQWESWVTFIQNDFNAGYAYGNNLAIRPYLQGKQRPDYVLLLNPDTVVQEDTFVKICDFMDAHPNAGGLGVKMIDGKGQFLPESKRGLPTPFVAFCKIIGLSNVTLRGRKHL
jgi:GT2 family glycosyltransferase